MFRWIRRFSDAREARKRAQASFQPPIQLQLKYDPEHAYREAFGETFAEHEARRMMRQFSSGIAQANPSGLITDISSGTASLYAKKYPLVIATTVDPGLSNSALEVYDDSTVIHQDLGDMPDGVRYTDDSDGNTEVHEDIIDASDSSVGIRDTGNSTSGEGSSVTDTSSSDKTAPSDG